MASRKDFMITKVLFFSLFIISCGQKTPANILLPADQSTLEEKEILMRAIDKIQGEFDMNGVSVNLLSIPYHVSNSLPEQIAGVCVHKNNGDPVGIAINGKILREWVIETPDYYGFFYKALLHEIGHCFFQRDHDGAHLEVPENILNSRVIDLSVMVDGGQANTPKVLWPYYVREVAGLDRISSLEDLINFLDNSGP